MLGSLAESLGFSSLPIFGILLRHLPAIKSLDRPRSFSFAPVSFSFYPLLESNLNHPRSAGFILRKFADDSAFVVTTAAWEIPFLSASSANYAKLPRSPIFSARNLGKC